MASPQVENGYTKIANEILEHLCFAGITGSEYRVVLFVIRKTYGFNKKKDRISISQFQKGTLMNRSHAIKTIQSLVDKRILVKDGGVYRFNKNWEDWVVHKRTPSAQSYTPASVQLGSKTSTQSYTYKRKKETITKESNASVAGVEINHLLKLFEPVNPTKEFYANTTQRSALNRLVAKFGVEKMEACIKKLPEINSQKYAPTITSPVQLENKFGQLVAFIRKSQGDNKYQIKL